MKKTALLILAAAVSVAAKAQIPVTSSALTYTQNFNTLDTGTTSTTGGTTLPTGWAIAEAGNNKDGKYRSGNGSTNSGDTYSYGATQTTDRALGSLASNSLRSFYGASFTNNANATLTSVAVSFKIEQWRAGDTAAKKDSVRFYYSTTASAIDTDLTAWTEVPALLALSPNSVSTSSNGNATDGNTLFSTVSGTLTFPTPIPAGSTLRVKWMDVNILGSDDGLAVDDLTMTFTTGSPSNPPSNSVAQTQGVTPLGVTILGEASTNGMTAAFTAPVTGAYSVALFDLAGREVARQIVHAAAGANTQVALQASLQAGLYTVRVSNGETYGVAKTAVR